MCVRWTKAHSTLQIKFVKVHNVESGKIRFVTWKLSATKQHHHHDEQISHLYIYVLKACVERSWYNTLWRSCVPKIQGLLVTLLPFFGTGGECKFAVFCIFTAHACFRAGWWEKRRDRKREECSSIPSALPCIFASIASWLSFVWAGYKMAK